MHAASGLLVVFLGLVELSQPRPTSSASSFSGPCRAWLFPCGKGSWVCTTEAAYWQFIFGPPPECPSVYPQTTAPPPGECRMVDGGCKFTDSTLTCKAWVDQFRGNTCGPLSEYDAYTKKYGSEDPKGFGQYPPPNQLCLPINNSCEWYDPCLSWRETCTGDNICSSADDYYEFLYGPKPSCPLPTPLEQPGQCAVKNDYCDWYECVSWIGWCDDTWVCGTTYDKEVYEAGPPPPCPPPPPNHHQPIKPGTCKFNESSSKCNFFPNKTECVSWIGWCGASWMCGTVHEREVYHMLPPPPCPLPPRPPVKPGTCGYNVSGSTCSFFPNTTNKDPCTQSIYPPGYKPTCGMLEKQWTYNSTTGQCVAFTYSPCGEEREGYDVFVTEEECVKTCLHRDPCHQPIYPPGFVPKCNVLKKQWTYNASNGQCVEFYYHPCGEDRVGYDVFETEEECSQTCMPKDPCKQSVYPPGYIPRCMVVEKQWTYNQTTKQCVEFSYHPCGQDRDGYDVFHTEQECVKKCLHRDPCHQPIYPPGYTPPCRVLIKQWTYNVMSGKCVEFEYYACGEDKESYDVFSTEEECTNSCLE